MSITLNKICINNRRKQPEIQQRHEPYHTFSTNMFKAESEIDNVNTL